MAMTSKPFCRSAWLAFWLNLRHAVEFGATALVVSLVVTFAGKALLLTLAGWFSYLLAANLYPDELASPAMTVILSLILAFIISSVFLAVVTFSTQTILQCFLVA